MTLTQQRKQIDKNSVSVNRAKVDTSHSYDLRAEIKA